MRVNVLKFLGKGVKVKRFTLFYQNKTTVDIKKSGRGIEGGQMGNKRMIWYFVKKEKTAMNMEQYELQYALQKDKLSKLLKFNSKNQNSFYIVLAVFKWAGKHSER